LEIFGCGFGENHFAHHLVPSHSFSSLIITSYNTMYYPSLYTILLAAASSIPTSSYPKPQDTFYTSLAGSAGYPTSIPPGAPVNQAGVCEAPNTLPSTPVTEAAPYYYPSVTVPHYLPTSNVVDVVTSTSVAEATTTTLVDPTDPTTSAPAATHFTSAAHVGTQMGWMGWMLSGICIVGGFIVL
jgi:hypothetical protein